MEKICQFCNTLIKYNNWREYACHCASCNANPKVRKKYRKGILTKKKLYGIPKTRIIKCKKCNKIFKLLLTDYKYLKGDYKKHCSYTCSNIREHSKQTKEKISIALSKKVPFICKFCKKKIFIAPGLLKSKKCCSMDCLKQYKRVESLRGKNKKEIYYKLSHFIFSLNKYPNEFDFKLIKRYGWYHFKNNKNGISRDHIIPINYGYINNIDPKIISHPANCQLIRHINNKKKGIVPQITICELKEKIKEWNKKHEESL